MAENDARDFRNALGKFATGVAVVTTRTDSGDNVGMTINSFSSVSLEPMLVLWSLAKTSTNYNEFMQADHYAIHVLNSDQQTVSNQFAAVDGDRFKGVAVAPGGNGVPLLSDYLARFECAIEHRHEGGDHVILVGRVQQYDHREGQPLLFVNGAYSFLA